MIFAIKKNKGTGIMAINTLFHKFLAAGHDKIIHNNIKAKISKKINESSKSCNGLIVLIPGLFSPNARVLRRPPGEQF